MDAEKLTRDLGGTWHGSYGMIRCPVHNDKTPSVSLRDGDSALLVKCHAGCDSTQVLKALGSGAASYSPPINKPLKTDFGQLALQIWRESRPLRAGDLATRYLNGRGLSAASPALRFHRNCAYKENKVLLYAPAMIAGYGPPDEPVAIQRTFLTADAEKLSMEANKRVLGSRYGHPCQLAPAGETLGLAEGVEDAQAVIDMFGVPCWSVGGIELYPSVIVPQIVRHIVIYTQHGVPAARAVRKARQALTSAERSFDVEWPKSKMDWADMAKQQAGRA